MDGFTAFPKTDFTPHVGPPTQGFGGRAPPVALPPQGSAAARGTSAATRSSQRPSAG